MRVEGAWRERCGGGVGGGGGKGDAVWSFVASRRFDIFHLGIMTFVIGDPA